MSLNQILITGASQGIGAAIAQRLASEPDMHLALVARNAKKLEEVACQCQAQGAKVEIFPCDLTQESQVAQMAKQVHQHFGPLDLLINNAGSFVQADLLTMDFAAFQSVMDANLTSAFLVTQAFIEPMLAKGSGSIFFMASVASQKAFPESGAYCVAKHALLGLARSYRARTANRGLRITTLMPGATESPSWQDDTMPANHLMPASDIAEALLAIYKLSERSVVEEITIRPQRGDL